MSSTTMIPNLPTRSLMLCEAALAKAGAQLPPLGIHWLNAAVNYVNTGHWIRRHGYECGRRVWRREELFDIVAREVRDQPVLYLEFGVYQGECMRYWSGALRHPEAVLHGFDSFQGLPVDWTVKMGKGHFDTSGHVPTIDDSRVRFFPGWFTETLPQYEWPDAYDRIVAVIDCDLYSSTVDVLAFLEPHLRPGAFLYFDDFNYAHDEQLAFQQFIDRTGADWILRGAAVDYGRLVFQLR